jgi:hypothetical protein
MKHTIPWVALLMLLSPSGARADRATANVCAASLQPYARLVFDAVIARPQPELMLRTVIEARTRELVFSDRLMVSAARPAAEAASLCLRLSRNCTGENC